MSTRTDRLKRWGQPAIVLLALAALWECVARFGAVPIYLLPSPSAIAIRAGEMGTDLLRNLWVTALEAVAGFVIGSGVGVLLGIWFAESDAAERSLLPLAIALKTVPVVAVAPLLVIWFGFGLVAKVLVAALISFFPCVVNTTIGLRDVDPRSLDLMYSLSASEWQVFKWLRWPSAMHHVFSALKVSVVLAVIGAVVGEFAGADEGIGFGILVASYRVDTPTMFVYIALSAALGMVLYAIVCAWERVAIPWSPVLRSGPLSGKEVLDATAP